MAVCSLAFTIHGTVSAGADPDCRCNRTTLGRAVKWWFNRRLIGLQHKATGHSSEWKREHEPA